MAREIESTATLIDEFIDAAHHVAALKNPLMLHYQATLEPLVEGLMKFTTAHDSFNHSVRLVEDYPLPGSQHQHIPGMCLILEIAHGNEHGAGTNTAIKILMTEKHFNIIEENGKIRSVSLKEATRALGEWTAKALPHSSASLREHMQKMQQTQSSRSPGPKR